MLENESSAWALVRRVLSGLTVVGQQKVVWDKDTNSWNFKDKIKLENPKGYIGETRIWVRRIPKCPVCGIYRSKGVDVEIRIVDNIPIIQHSHYEYVSNCRGQNHKPKNYPHRCQIYDTQCVILMEDLANVS